MSSYRVHSISSILILLSLLFSISFSEQSDREALLSFKANSDESNSLSSWNSSSKQCFGSWIGVSCDSATGRVTGLVLESLGLTGSVKPLSQLTELRHLSLKNNSLGSSLNLSSWQNLKHLYLSHNRFSGRFPGGISKLRRLQRLDLSHNLFSGEIPAKELSQLPRLLTLRLESNRFEGILEDSGNKSPSSTVSDFNVSENNLSGEIPKWLRRFNATSFAKNDNLCGKPLSNNCSSSKKNDEEQRSPGGRRTRLSRSVEMSIVVLLVVTAVTALVTAVVALALCQRRERSSVKSRRVVGGKVGIDEKGHGLVVMEGGSKGIADVEGLLRASAEMLGKGVVGTTYKVAMEEGNYVAVKRVKSGVKIGKEADWWLRHVLGELRHVNIVSLRAYHRSQTQTHHLLLLLYDYFPLGSLHNLLHGYRGPGKTPVNWATRLKLASDAAKGIAFLHRHHCHNKMKLFHGHVSSENILIDQMGNACIADAGLYQLLRGANNNKYTQKSDVYSFGAILLEILTGKVGQREWGGWDELDVEVLRTKETEVEISALVQVAALCLSHFPKDRPSMGAVYRMIEDIRTKGVNEGRFKSVIDDVLGASSTSSSSPE